MLDFGCQAIGPDTKRRVKAMQLGISNYSEGKTQQHNSVCVTIGNMVIYFSYRTPVAFQSCGELVVRQNEWGPTTGKHLRWIDGGDKSSRVDGDTFCTRLNKAWSDEIERLVK